MFTEDDCYPFTEYIKRKTKQIQKQTVLNLLHGPPESVLLCFIFPARRFIGGNIQRYVTMASSAVAALMLARERQRIGAQGTHEVFLAKLLAAGAYASSYASCIYHILLYSDGTPVAVAGSAVHYKTNSRIIRRIIRFGLVVEYHPDYQVNYQPDYRPGSTEVPAW